MKIAIDARWIYERISGVGVYTRELVRVLPSVGPDHRYLLYFSDPAFRERTLDETGLRGNSAVETAIVPWGVFSPAGQLFMGARFARDGVDLFHSTNYMIPFMAFSRRHGRGPVCVVTVHDVIPMAMRNLVRRSLKNRLFPLYRRLMIEVGARADAIVTDSAASRTDVIRHLRIPPERESAVHVVHCGVNPAFRAGPGTGADAGSDPLRERVILYVGRADPYKNLVGLVKAFARLRRDCVAPVVLQIVGPPDPRYPEAGECARALGVADGVRWTGYASEDALVANYRSADVVVLPSRYEGFGLPVIEAMASGTPVVCSDIPVLREVAGDAAIFADPDDDACLADAMRRVLTDRGLANSLRGRGLERARQFTWEETARRTLAVYGSAVSGRKAGA